MVPAHTLDAVRRAARCLLRTARHPSAAFVAGAAPGPVTFLDHLYEQGGTFGDVYTAIVEAVVAAAAERAGGGDPFVAYVVPGSPLVAERTVALLRADERVTVEVLSAPSFLDLVWARLGVDPVDAGVRLVDAGDFATQAAGERGPLLVAQGRR
jgi:tetrapyrrole methylase family protein/MazG family protein